MTFQMRNGLLTTVVLMAGMAMNSAVDAQLVATTNQGELVQIDFDLGIAVLVGDAGTFKGRNLGWTGLFSAQLMDQISINAWRDNAGNAHGMAVWTSVYHGVPADPNLDAPGPGASGYPWYIAVQLLSVSGNKALVVGVVERSPQSPEDEGTPVFLSIVDKGSGVNDAPDELEASTGAPPNPAPIESGNFTVR